MDEQNQPDIHTAVSSNTQNVFISDKVSISILMIILPIIGFILGMYFQSVSSSTDQQNEQDAANIVMLEPTPTITIVEEELVSTYPTENSRLVVGNYDIPFSVLVPNEWKVEANEYAMAISNDDYLLELTTSSLGTLDCLYPGDLGFGSYDPEAEYKIPFIRPEFNTFTQILASSTQYRRGSSQFDLENSFQAQSQVTLETVCELDAATGRYVNDTNIGGGIKYSYPNSNNYSILQEMDNILSSITLLQIEE